MLELAGVAALRFHQAVAVGGDGVGQFQQGLLAGRRGAAAPGLEGVAGGGIGGVHVGIVGVGRAGDRLAGNGADQIKILRALGLRVLAVDEMLEGGHRHGLSPRGDGCLF
ncbi:hypothetical protein D3C87_1556580 [compost metagenome]